MTNMHRCTAGSRNLAVMTWMLCLLGFGLLASLSTENVPHPTVKKMIDFGIWVKSYNSSKNYKQLVQNYVPLVYSYYDLKHDK